MTGIVNTNGPFKHVLSYEVEFDGFDLAIAREKRGFTQVVMAERLGPEWYQQKVAKLEACRCVRMPLDEWEVIVRALTSLE